MGKTPEVVEACFTPFFGVVELVLKPGLHLLPALLVDTGLNLLPDAEEILHLTDTTVIAECHFLKYGPATLKPVVPGHMVEPQQVSLWTRVDVIIHRTVRLPIL